MANVIAGAVSGEYFVLIVNLTIFLEPEWTVSKQPIRPKAEWAFDLEAMKVTGRMG